jgi:4-amino-4-deoxy-L-arabinose transferase-like glycosyltransferase
MLTNACVFAACAAVFVLAFWSYRTGRPRTALLLILTAGLLLRAFAASDPFLHTWDERYHALVARNLMSHPLTPTLFDKPALPYDPANWTANDVWLEKGPIPLWALSSALAVFGTSEFALRVPSVLVSLASVYLTFLIASALFGTRVALLAAFFHAINGLLIELPAGRVSSDHVDAFFVFFVEVGVWLSVRYAVGARTTTVAFLIGVATGAAFLCKWWPAFVVLPVWLTGALYAGERRTARLLSAFALIAAGGLLVAAPYLLYVHAAFPEEAGWVLRKYAGAFVNSVDEHSAPAYFYLARTGIVFGELIYVPLLLGLADLVRRRARLEVAMPTVWWLLPVAVFSLAETKRPTYLLISAPAFFILASCYWFRLSDLARGSRLGTRWAAYALLTLLIALPVRYTIDRITPLEDRFHTPSWAADVKALRARLGARDDVVVFNVQHNIEAMFYSGVTVYDFVPEAAVLRRIIGSGRRVVINDDGRLPPEVAAMSHVEVLRLCAATDRD